MRNINTLKKNYEFRRIYSKGSSFVTPYLVLYVQRTKQPDMRIGFTVGTKLGNAVVRNRVRRRLREIFLALRPRLGSGARMVVVARNRAAQADYTHLYRAFEYACGKLGMLAPDQVQTPQPTVSESAGVRVEKPAGLPEQPLDGN